MKKENRHDNVFKRIKRFLEKHINGTKGAVSLLLVLVMSPLLSTALILVESARYQDAVQLMEEIMDSSAFSTLAEYDSYLDERFGLLSISQETNINDVFRQYLDDNVPALGKSITVNSKNASGKFALSNTDVLKQQLLEYSEISVAAEAITEGIDLDELLKKLEEQLDMTEIKEEVEAVSAGVDLAAEIEKLLEGIIDAKNQYNDKYSPALTAYKDAYSDFEAKASELVSALATAEGNLEEGADHDSIYEEKAVKDAIDALKKSRDTYKKAASTLKTEFSTLKGYIDTIISAADGLPSKLEKFDDATSKSDLAGKCTTSTYDWIKIVADQITTTFKTTVGSDFKDVAQGEIDALEAQIKKLGELEDKTITSDWITAKIQSEYGRVSITSISNSFATRMDRLIDVLMMKQFSALENGGRMAVLMGDIKKKGRLYSMLAEIVKPGTLENIIIKAQHNCFSDRTQYSGKFIPILHEYVMIVRKDSPVLIPILMTQSSTVDIRDMPGATWRDVVAAVLEQCKEPVALSFLYEQIEPHKKAQTNKWWKEKIRQTLQINPMHFTHDGRGLWSLNRNAA